MRLRINSNWFKMSKQLLLARLETSLAIRYKTQLGGLGIFKRKGQLFSRILISNWSKLDHLDRNTFDNFLCTIGRIETIAS